MKINILKMLSGNYQLTLKVSNKSSIILIAKPDDKITFIHEQFNQLLIKVKIMSNNLVKKMSAKSIIGNVKALSLKTFYEDGEINTKAPKTLDMFQLIGVAKGFKTGDSEHGTWVSFQGTFKATGLIADENGEIDTFRSAVAFLPEPASSMLHQALSDNDEVEMAFVIGIAPCNTPIGYEYICKPIFAPTETDAIASIESRMKALTSPTSKDTVEKTALKEVEKTPSKK